MPTGELDRQEQYRGFTGTPNGVVKVLGAGFDTSETCNLACPGCYRLKDNLERSFMAPETASSLLHKLREANTSEVYFLGAEPTLNPHLPQILKEAVDLDFKFVLVISNGIRFANEAYARQVLIPGVSLLMQRHTIDNDKAAQRIQEASVGKKGMLDRSRKAWTNATKIFQEKGGEDKLMVQSCLTDEAMADGNLDRLFKWARETLGTLPIMEYESPPHTGAADQLMWMVNYLPLTGRIVDQLERFMAIDQQLGLKVPREKDALSPQAYNSSCTMIKEGGQITKEGIYLPCTNMGQKSTHPLQYGNLLHTSLDNIEQNETRQAFIKSDFRLKGCNDPCEGSGCWWTGLVTTGCYRLCQLNCVFNEEKHTIDDIPDLCKSCGLNDFRQAGILNCGHGTRPSLALGEEEKAICRI